MARDGRSALRVLVAEDEAAVADEIGSLIRGWGYHTRISYDGRSVRSTVRDWTPDLALLDLGLPGVNGLDLLRELRAMEVESVAMSGRPTVHLALETIASGATVFL